MWLQEHAGYKSAQHAPVYLPTCLHAVGFILTPCIIMCNCAFEGQLWIATAHCHTFFGHKAPCVIKDRVLYLYCSKQNIYAIFDWGIAYNQRPSFVCSTVTSCLYHLCTALVSMSSCSLPLHPHYLTADTCAGPTSLSMDSGGSHASQSAQVCTANHFLSPSSLLHRSHLYDVADRLQESCGNHAWLLIWLYTGRIKWLFLHISPLPLQYSPTTPQMTLQLPFLRWGRQVVQGQYQVLK